MVFAFAGLSTITNFFAMARDTLAAHWDTPCVSPRPSLMYLAIAGLSWPLLYGLFRLRARGREHLPAAGGFVLAANHNSNFDPWPLGLPLFPRRYLRFMGKSELFFTPLKQIAYGAGAFPVRRGQADLEAMETATQLCREGHIVVMFPEGTRRKKGLRKKHEARAHTGAARIALEAGVPLDPGRDRRHRPARAPRAAAGGVRPGDPARRPRRARGRAAGRDRAADGRDRRARALGVKPLLIVDGDSFAHRYYHALPKSIRRADGGGGNLIDGVGGLLIRLWEEEAPRAVLAAWDTLTVPTYRHTALPAYQSGREFDKELLDQLDLMPQLVEAMGFAPAKEAGYEADDFLAAGVAFEEARGGTALVASGDRDTFQLASERTTDPAAAEGRRRAGADRAGRGARALRRRADAGARLHRAARRSLGQDPRRARRRRQDRRLAAGAVRQPRGGARGGPVRGRGRRAAALPPHRDDGRRRAAAAARRPGADVGPRRRARGRVGSRPGSRAAWRRCRPPDQSSAGAPAPDGRAPGAAGAAARARRRDRRAAGDGRAAGTRAHVRSPRVPAGDRVAAPLRQRHGRDGRRRGRLPFSRPASPWRRSIAAASRSCARPATTRSPTGRWASACSTTWRSRRATRRRSSGSRGSRSSTTTCTTATARRRSSAATTRCSSSRSTSGRSIRARAGRGRATRRR